MSGWYVGLRGGAPLGVSTFNSFEHGNYRFGWSGGVYAGYRFNPLISVEASATQGLVRTVSEEGCYGYWLGHDGNHYFAPVEGMEGWEYEDLESRIRLGQYGLHVNVNLLALWPAARNSRWALSLSPAIYAATTRAKVTTTQGGHTVLSPSTRWHLGYGADLLLECALSPRLTAGLYTGITYLEGERMDGMPIHLHQKNTLLESGIRLTWSLGRAARPAARISAQGMGIDPAAAPAAQARRVETTDNKEQ